ncbi:Subtilisin-like protease 4 [Linum perenne]
MGCKMLGTHLAMFLLVLTFRIGSSQVSRVGVDESSNQETYIVFVQRPLGVASAEPEDLERWYRAFLPEVTTESASNEERMVYSYHTVLTGFAARLTAGEAKEMGQKEGFVSARVEKTMHLHTTHSSRFLGLHQDYGFWNRSNFGKGVVIGVLDTGIALNHPSFDDKGMPPPPAKWKGRCEFKRKVCNNKIIGARTFLSPRQKPIDDNGHGTHTAGTAAGSPVSGASYYDQLNGTAIGIAPLAHLAVYKICNAAGSCKETDILAAMDAAVEDGVDILSLSLGAGSFPFYEDGIAVGAYGAAQKGVLVTCSAGNLGPKKASLSNEAPWILTVGAGTMDRSVRATVKLGNNAELNGESLSQPKGSPPKLLPLVYAGANGNPTSALCEPGSLKGVDVKGKVVLCEVDASRLGKIQKGEEVKRAGGAAMILMNDEHAGFETTPDLHLLPASHVSYVDGMNIKRYINSSSSPTATVVSKGTIFGLPYAPQVATFSSRGPSLASPGILKPDILGPGHRILAAWPSPRGQFSFNLMSGTSMACPHLSGIAALLKSSHPDWSPAAIKSAIMTTADLTDLGGNLITDQQFAAVNVFAIGSGHVNPRRADNPGLVYDIQPDDYIPYLCGLGYNDTQVGFTVQKRVDCSTLSKTAEGHLNYPSFTVRLGSDSITYTRRVTNVGPAKSTYSPRIIAPQGVHVKVKPKLLRFSKAKQSATYSVTFRRRTKNEDIPFAQGYLTWVSKKHVVRSPILINFE